MVDLDELESAVMFVSSNGGYDNEAYLNRGTGQIFYNSALDGPDEDLPDDIADKKKYVSIPSERDLDLGMRLWIDFFREHAPDLYREACGISGRPKAYARLRDLMERSGLVEKWYNFKQAALDEALKEWCADHELEISEAAAR